MTARSAAGQILAGLDGIRGWQDDLRRDLHQHPELSHQEHRTAGIVAGQLREHEYQVHEGVGGTGVVGVRRNGDGPTVLLRADMDALPVAEATELSYASTATGQDGNGRAVPVMHACGHDTHVTCLLGAARLLSEGSTYWSGTVVALFQPAEETADGAKGMVDDGLADLLPGVDVALGQHVMPRPAGQLAVQSGPAMSAADNVRVTVHGRGGHGSMPHATVDPVLLAAMIVIRLQTVVARETRPGELVVLTVGSIQAGTKSNVIPDHAVLELNLRTYDEQTRSAVLEAVRRIVVAECQASGSPKDPEFEVYGSFPLTDNDSATTERVRSAFDDFFPEGTLSSDFALSSGSEDFSDIPHALGVPYSYWFFGGTDPEMFQRARERGRIAQDIPVNHSANFAPVSQPTVDTGTQALVVAALAWLAR